MTQKWHVLLKFCKEESGFLESRKATCTYWNNLLIYRLILNFLGSSISKSLISRKKEASKPSMYPLQIPKSYPSSKRANYTASHSNFRSQTGNSAKGMKKPLLKGLEISKPILSSFFNLQFSDCLKSHIIIETIFRNKLIKFTLSRAWVDRPERSQDLNLKLLTWLQSI